MKQPTEITVGPTITFKAKTYTVYNHDDTAAYTAVKIPKLNSSHCAIEEFRKHPQYSPYANSNLFNNILSRVQNKIFGLRKELRLDQLPNGVTADQTGFLAVITITAPDSWR